MVERAAAVVLADQHEGGAQHVAPVDAHRRGNRLHQPRLARPQRAAQRDRRPVGQHTGQGVPQGVGGRFIVGVVDEWRHFGLKGTYEARASHRRVLIELNEHDLADRLRVPHEGVHRNIRIFIIFQLAKSAAVDARSRM